LIPKDGLGDPFFKIDHAIGVGIKGIKLLFGALIAVVFGLSFFERKTAVFVEVSVFENAPKLLVVPVVEEGLPDGSPLFGRDRYVERISIDEIHNGLEVIVGRGGHGLLDLDLSLGAANLFVIVKIFGGEVHPNIDRVDVGTEHVLGACLVFTTGDEIIRIHVAHGEESLIVFFSSLCPVKFIRRNS